MKKIWGDFELEVLSPMFLRGADQKTASFRLASLKGVLRYWFRAVAAGILNHEKLYNLEAQLFGSTGRKSPLVLTLLEEKCKLFNDFWKAINRSQALGYLLGPGVHPGTIPLAPGSKVKFRLLTWGEKPLRYYHLATGILWMASFFGGLGARSRRGFGSFSIKFISGQKPLVSFEIPEGKEVAYLKGVPLAIQKFLKKEFSLTLQEDFEDYFYPRFYESKWQVTLKCFSNWEDALIFAGKKLRLFRLHPDSRKKNILFGKGSHSRDYETILNFLKKNAKPSGKVQKSSARNFLELKNIALGLPLNFGKKMAVKLKEKDREPRALRRGSPLFMSLNSTGNNLFLVFSSFDEKFYPLKGNQKLVLLKDEKEIPIKPPETTSYAMEFINFLDQKTSKGATSNGAG